MIERTTSQRRFQAALAGLVCVVCCACKSRDPAPLPPRHAPAAAETRAAPPAEPDAKFHLPPEHTFELPDDVGNDPDETLQEMRHNCCDEMPASEIEATVHTGEAKQATAPAPHKPRNVKAHPSTP